MAATFRVRAVGIDLDGTLLDTVGDIAAALNATLAELGRPPLAVDAVRALVGRGVAVLMQRALARSPDDHGGNDDAFARGQAAFLRHYERENGLSAALFPGVADGLSALRAKGLRLACVTNKPQAFAEALLERTGLARHFELTVGGGAVARGKPDPMPLEHACARFGIAPSQMVMIGDSVNDALSARAAGMPVIIVPYGYNEGHPVAAIDADAFVGTLLEAAGRIEAAA